MAERDGRIELAETLSEGQRQFVQDFVARLEVIDSVWGVSLLIPQDPNRRQTLWVTIPHCIGYSAGIADPDVQTAVRDIIEEMRSSDGLFEYRVFTPFAARISSETAQLRRDNLIPLWQRSS